MFKKEHASCTGRFEDSEIESYNGSEISTLRYYAGKAFSPVTRVSGGNLNDANRINLREMISFEPLIERRDGISQVELRAMLNHMVVYIRKLSESTSDDISLG